MRWVFYIGNLRSLNDLARQARADYIVHTGDFGFYDDSSLDRIADKYVNYVASTQFRDCTKPDDIILGPLSTLHNILLC